MLLDLAGAPALERTLRRVRRATRLGEVVLATTPRPEDRALIELAERLGVPAFAGDEEDVLDRCYQAARSRGAELVVRLTGDCPLHAPEVIDVVVGAFLERAEE